MGWAAGPFKKIIFAESNIKRECSLFLPKALNTMQSRPDKMALMA